MQKDRSWQRRSKKQFKIGRIVDCSFRQVEKWCLRNFNKEQAGFFDEEEEAFDHYDEVVTEQHLPTEEEIRRDQLKPYDTFQKACKARGYLEDAEEWHRTLMEAAKTAWPSELRLLFCLILIKNEPTLAKELWEQRKDSLSADHLKKAEEHDEDPEVAYNRALLDIKMIMQAEGSNMEDLDLPTPVLDEGYDALPMELKVELDYNRAKCKKAYEKSVKLMKGNLQQTHLFRTLKKCVDENNAHHNYFFVDAPAGTGKTFVFNAILNYVRSLTDCGSNGIGLARASTGIASLLLFGGRTAHNSFHLGKDVDECTRIMVDEKGGLFKILKKAKIIIWDEATMAGKHLLHAIDDCLRQIMQQPNLPFGGKLLVMGGDFRQTLTVIPGGNEAQIVDGCIQSSFLWDNVNIKNLTKNMRVLKNLTPFNKESLQKWDKFLMKVGNGICESSTQIKRHFHSEEMIRLPKEVISKAKDAEELVTEIYPKMQESNFGKTATLTPKNCDVDKINDICLRRMKGKLHVMESEDWVGGLESKKSHPYTEENLNSRNENGLPVHGLRLKEQVPIMLMRNLTPLHGACNGTRMIIESIYKCNIVARFLIGDRAGQRYFIPRITLTGDSPKYSHILKRKQFPVRVAFAMTINKSQGQTLNKVGLYLPRPVFSHGQLYVALSRVGDPKDIKVLINENTWQGFFDGHCYTRNVVFQQIIHNIKMNKDDKKRQESDIEADFHRLKISD